MTDDAAIQGVFDHAGGTFPVLKGLTDASAEAWGVTGFPNVRVVKDGARAGDDMAAVKAAVGS